MGIAIGMLIIDLAFDIIIADKPHDDQTKIIAHLYYHTMLNATHVNAILAALMLTMAIGAAIGLADAYQPTTPVRKWRAWVSLICLNVMGNGNYLAVVMPRYIRIRSSSAFNSSDFDGWLEVLRARCVLVLSLSCAVSICMWLTLEQFPVKECLKKH